MDKMYAIMTDATREEVRGVLNKLGFKHELSVEDHYIDSYLNVRGVNVLVAKPRNEDLNLYRDELYQSKFFIPVPETIITADPIDMFADRQDYFNLGDREKNMAEVIVKRNLEVINSRIKKPHIRSHLFAIEGKRRGDKCVIVAKSYRDILQ